MEFRGLKQQIPSIVNMKTSSNSQFPCLRDQKICAKLFKQFFSNNSVIVLSWKAEPSSEEYKLFPVAPYNKGYLLNNCNKTLQLSRFKSIQNKIKNAVKLKTS